MGVFYNIFVIKIRFVAKWPLFFLDSLKKKKYNIYVIKLNFKRVGEKKWPFGHKTGKEHLWTNI